MKKFAIYYLQSVLGVNMYIIAYFFYIFAEKI